MNPNVVRRPEQIKLIMECRQSGLSDYQWCKTKNIHPGTFYNWVSKLRKSGYTFPESKSKSTGIPVRQEVVRLNLIEHEIPAPVMVEQNVSHLPLSDSSNVATEIRYGNITLRLFDGADISVVKKLFSVSEVCRMLGDISVAANIYIITSYTDMRKSVDGLCAIVMEQLKEEPNGHSIYLFGGRRCDRIKILSREPDGYVLLYKRMRVAKTETNLEKTRMY